MCYAKEEYYVMSKPRLNCRFNQLINQITGWDQLNIYIYILEL